MERALVSLVDCTVCPRDCHIDRFADKFGVCKVGGLAALPLTDGCSFTLPADIHRSGQRGSRV